MNAVDLDGIEFGKYFSLLQECMPAVTGIYVCNSAGQLISSETASNSTDLAHYIGNIRVNEALPGRACSWLKIEKHKYDTLYSRRINQSSGEALGYLVISISALSELGDEIRHIQCMCEKVITCIEQEASLKYLLNTASVKSACLQDELDHMCVDAAADEVYAHEGETLTEFLVEHVEHLGVNMVALMLYKNERIFCAENAAYSMNISSSYLRKLGKHYLMNVGRDADCLLVNDLTNKKQRSLGPDFHYKTLMSPVLDGFGEVIGVLMCLNNANCADFYDSDRYQVKGISRQVSRIVQTNYDSLTGLFNRRAFEQALAAVLRSPCQKGKYYSLFNIDMYQLKIINEGFGREAGDVAIQHVGNLLKMKLRTTDRICYLGEARFCVLLDKCTIEQALNVAEKLRQYIEGNSIEFDGDSVSLSVTIGVTPIESHADGVDQAMDAAEIARDAAKECSYRHIHLYRQNDSGLIERKERIHWASRIKKALHEDRFSVYCQTIKSSSATDQAYHFEILLRMYDEGKLIGPVDFIPAAEQFHLMPVIDRWVINATFSLLSAANLAQTAGEGLVSINLSGQSLADLEFAEFILNKLAEYDISPQCICFEITETAAIGSIESAHKIFAILKAKGCCFSLDDFGTGLSSFTYLKELPVDYVKIDGSFVSTMLDDRISHAVVVSINKVGHVMGLKTVAEYVENDAIEDMLVSMGVDYLQGYNIAKPVPLKDYIAELPISRPACTG